MGLFSLVFGSPKRSARRRHRPRTEAQRARAEERRRAAEQRKLDRQAAAWIRKDNARKAREEHRRRMAEVRMVKAADREKRREERERAYLRKTGWSESEINELFRDREHTNPAFRYARMARALRLLRNPSAAQDSQTFHGSPGFTDGHNMVLGRITEIDYEVPRGSQREGLWSHKTGDYGVWQGHGPKPLLVENPRTRRPQLEMAGSRMTFNPHLGLLG